MPDRHFQHAKLSSLSVVWTTGGDTFYSKPPSGIVSVSYWHCARHSESEDLYQTQCKTKLGYRYVKWICAKNTHCLDVILKVRPEQSLWWSEEEKTKHIDDI